MIWGYLLSFVGMLGFYLAGRKLWWAWYVNIANQVLWVVYSIITDQRGFLIGAGFYTVIFVKNAINWTRDHNREKEKKPTTFLDLPTDGELSLGLVDERLYEKNKQALKKEAKLTMGVTRESRGYGVMAGQCNNLNVDPTYPYYCVRHISHIYHVDPQVRRHGYAGVFWD